MSVKPPDDSITDIIVGDKPKLEALTMVERRSWATRLRTQAQDLIELANRIHPEGSDTIHIVNGDNMATIATRWENVKKELVTKDTEIAQKNEQLVSLQSEKEALSAQNAELNKSMTDLRLLSQSQAAELRNIRTEQIIVQQRIADITASSNKLLAQYEADKAAWENERIEINFKLAETVDKLERVRVIIGELPDDDDRKALEEMASVGPQVVQGTDKDDELYLPDELDEALPATNFVFHVKK
jgi:transcriptional regulator with XRE-family HTH domain